MDHATAAAVKSTATERAISATTYTASGSALYFGLTANEIAAFVGAAVAVLSLVVQIWYKHQHLQLAKIAVKDGAEAVEKAAEP